MLCFMLACSSHGGGTTAGRHSCRESGLWGGWWGWYHCRSPQLQGIGSLGRVVGLRRCRGLSTAELWLPLKPGQPWGRRAGERRWEKGKVSLAPYWGVGEEGAWERRGAHMEASSVRWSWGEMAWGRRGRAWRWVASWVGLPCFWGGVLTVHPWVL